jgi:pyruvyl transferase EpsO
MPPATISEIHSALHNALAFLPASGICALLDFPNHRNLGDHMIWLGSSRYLSNEKGYRIAYASDDTRFRPREMEESIGDGPIFFTGGGNLGDLWPRSQVFREQIVSHYPDRPIVIFPQSMHFTDGDALKRAEDAFNNHPDLTIFLRDEHSYDLALRHFPGCRVEQAPDVSFALDNLQQKAPPAEPSGSWLYLCRGDFELDRDFSIPPEIAGVMARQDWASLSREWDFLQQQPAENALRPRRPLADRLRKFLPSRNNRPQGAPKPSMEMQLRDFSTEIVQTGIDQLADFQFVATNRLHGHILSLLLGKPTTLLPNAYHKNRSFYETWTRDLPHSRFGNDALLEFFQDGARDASP